LKSDDANEGVDAATDETPTRGVRITGAVPVDGLAQLPDDAAAPLPMSDLPHWGDPPTGQLPAVMSSDDNPAAVPGPTWREDKADWDYEDQTFEPAMLADEASAVSSVEDREARQPWEFDAPSPATVATEGFSADAYEAIPTEEELFAGLGALSAAGASTGADDAPRTIRRRRKRADRTDEPTCSMRPALRAMSPLMLMLMLMQWTALKTPTSHHGGRSPALSDASSPRMTPSASVSTGATFDSVISHQRALEPSVQPSGTSLLPWRRGSPSALPSSWHSTSVRSSRDSPWQP